MKLPIRRASKLARELSSNQQAKRVAMKASEIHRQEMVEPEPMVFEGAQRRAKIMGKLARVIAAKRSLRKPGSSSLTT